MVDFESRSQRCQVSFHEKTADTAVLVICTCPVGVGSESRLCGETVTGHGASSELPSGLLLPLLAGLGASGHFLLHPSAPFDLKQVTWTVSASVT